MILLKQVSRPKKIEQKSKRISEQVKVWDYKFETATVVGILMKKYQNVSLVYLSISGF